MKLGVILGGTMGKKIELDDELILEAERLGYDSVWTGEAYGSDTVAATAWILARTTRIRAATGIMQMPARTPSCAAGTAITLAHLSGGRFIMGLGASGPQVIEGWHGLPYGRPLTRTREYISIVRAILAREAPLEHDGFHYQIPYRGEGASGLGKPLKSIPHGVPVPIYTASISPKGVECAAEIADGVLPIWMNPERFDIFEKPIQRGFEKAGGGKSLENFDVATMAPVVLGDDLDQCRAPVKAKLALYIGGMGAREKNFYNDFAKRLGYEEAAVRIQDLFLAGKKQEAMAAVPDQLVDDLALVGPKERILDRLEAWKEAGAKGHVGSMLISSKPTPEILRIIAEAVL